MEMRSNLLNETPPYHPDMSEPVVAPKAQYGYLEGDAPELIGKEVWFHTNRHNILHNKNELSPECIVLVLDFLEKFKQ